MNKCESVLFSVTKCLPQQVLGISLQFHEQAFGRPALMYSSFFIKIPQETHLHKEEEKTKNLAKLHSDIFFCFLILLIFSHASVAASVAPKGVTFKQKHNSISLPSNWYTSHHTLLKFSFLSRCHKQISALLLYSEIRHSDWLKLIHVNYNIQSNAFFQH